MPIEVPPLPALLAGPGPLSSSSSNTNSARRRHRIGNSELTSTPRKYNDVLNQPTAAVVATADQQDSRRDSRDTVATVGSIGHAAGANYEFGQTTHEQRTLNIEDSLAELQEQHLSSAATTAADDSLPSQQPNLYFEHPQSGDSAAPSCSSRRTSVETKGGCSKESSDVRDITESGKLIFQVSSQRNRTPSHSTSDSGTEYNGVKKKVASNSDEDRNLVTVSRIPPLAIQAAVNLNSLRMGTPRTPHTPHAPVYANAAAAALSTPHAGGFIGLTGVQDLSGKVSAAGIYPAIARDIAPLPMNTTTAVWRHDPSLLLHGMPATGVLLTPRRGSPPPPSAYGFGHTGKGNVTATERTKCINTLPAAPFLFQCYSTQNAPIEGFNGGVPVAAATVQSAQYSPRLIQFTNLDCFQAPTGPSGISYSPAHDGGIHCCQPSPGNTLYMVPPESWLVHSPACERTNFSTSPAPPPSMHQETLDPLRAMVNNFSEGLPFKTHANQSRSNDASDQQSYLQLPGEHPQKSQVSFDGSDWEEAPSQWRKRSSTVTKAGDCASRSPPPSNHSRYLCSRNLGVDMLSAPVDTTDANSSHPYTVDSGPFDALSKQREIQLTENDFYTGNKNNHGVPSLDVCSAAAAAAYAVRISLSKSGSPNRQQSPMQQQPVQNCGATDTSALWCMASSKLATHLQPPPNYHHRDVCFCHPTTDCVGGGERNVSTPLWEEPLEPTVAVYPFTRYPTTSSAKQLQLGPQRCKESSFFQLSNFPGGVRSISSGMSELRPPSQRHECCNSAKAMNSIKAMSAIDSPSFGGTSNFDTASNFGVPLSAAMSQVGSTAAAPSLNCCDPTEQQRPTTYLPESQLTVFPQLTSSPVDYRLYSEVPRSYLMEGGCGNAETDGNHHQSELLRGAVDNRNLDKARHHCILSPFQVHKTDHDGSSAFDTNKKLHNTAAEDSLESSNGEDEDAGPVRLFVGRIPKTYRSSDLKRLFELYGTVLECNIIRDRRSSQSRGCGFVRLPTVKAARAAIRALNQSCHLTPDLGPLQVKFASGELERLGLPITYQPGGECVKVFFGNLAPATTEAELIEIFNYFGEFEEVCVLRDRNRRSKCSGFVTFRSMMSAQSCIQSLNGQYVIPGATRPIEVRFAESKSQRGSKKPAESVATQVPESLVGFRHARILTEKVTQPVFPSETGHSATKSCATSKKHFDCDFRRGSSGGPSGGGSGGRPFAYTQQTSDLHQFQTKQNEGSSNLHLSRSTQSFEEPKIRSPFQHSVPLSEYAPLQNRSRPALMAAKGMRNATALQRSANRNYVPSFSPSKNDARMIREEEFRRERSSPSPSSAERPSYVEQGHRTALDYGMAALQQHGCLSQQRKHNFINYGDAYQAPSKTCETIEYDHGVTGGIRSGQTPSSLRFPQTSFAHDDNCPSEICTGLDSRPTGFGAGYSADLNRYTTITAVAAEDCCPMSRWEGKHVSCCENARILPDSMATKPLSGPQVPVIHGKRDMYHNSAQNIPTPATSAGEGSSSTGEYNVIKSLKQTDDFFSGGGSPTRDHSRGTFLKPFRTCHAPDPNRGSMSRCPANQRASNYHPPAIVEIAH